MIDSIRQDAVRRGITRLCHFTPSVNLVHIASGQSGILATKKLKEADRNTFTPTDLDRFDRNEGCICCSIENPNAWYFDLAKARNVLFSDWVVLFIDPKYLWQHGTRFCCRNAAAEFGQSVGEGELAFQGLFAESVTGSKGYTFTRTAVRLPCCPTDEQAEVLIPDQVALNNILGIAVSSEKQAKNEMARFRLMNLPENTFRFVIAPDLFDKRTLSRCIRSGRRPTETEWHP